MLRSLSIICHYFLIDIFYKLKIKRIYTRSDYYSLVVLYQQLIGMMLPGGPGGPGTPANLKIIEILLSYQSKVLGNFL